MNLDLFEKTELSIRPVVLDGLDLSETAETAARVLCIAPEYVQVIDAREDLLTFDITAPDLKPENLFGRGRILLEELGKLDGIQILPETGFHTAGILGTLALPPEEGAAAARRSSELSEGILKAIRRRVCVFPTGAEILSGQITDTNSPYLAELLEGVGCRVVIADPIPDDFDTATGRLRLAMEEGYGLIITTGGVGAEAKDVNVDAVIAVSDTSYPMPVIHFTAGEGRHLRDAVRIVCGVSGPSVLVTLPGPHAEVEACAEALLSFVAGELSPAELSVRLAGILRQRWAHAIHKEHHK